MPTKAKKKTKKAKLDAVQSAINQRYGAGTVILGNDPSLLVSRIPCGVMTVDDLLGGGFPRDRHTELYGPYSVGKTALALYLVAFAQAMGLKCAYVDAERTYDPIFAALLGVDIAKLKLHKQKESGERCIDIMETFLRSGEYDVIVLDSIASLLPQAERGKAMEAATMGTYQARLMSAAMRRLTTANDKTAIVYINQLREAIGVMFGDKNVTSGGRAMGFYAGVRLELVRIENLKEKTIVIDPKTGEDKEVDVVVGHRVLVRKQKDKTGGGNPYDSTTFVYDYKLGGIDPIEDLMFLGRKYGFIKLEKKSKSSTWWVDGYEDERLAGRKAFKKWLRRNVAVAEDLTEMIVNRKDNEDEDD